MAHFKSTLIILSKSTQVIAGNLPFEAARYEASATKSIQNEEVKTLVTKDLWKKQWVEELWKKEIEKSYLKPINAEIHN